MTYVNWEKVPKDKIGPYPIVREWKDYISFEEIPNILPVAPPSPEIRQNIIAYMNNFGEYDGVATSRRQFTSAPTLLERLEYHDRLMEFVKHSENACSDLEFCNSMDDIAQLNYTASFDWKYDCYSDSGRIRRVYSITEEMLLSSASCTIHFLKAQSGAVVMNTLFFQRVLQCCRLWIEKLETISVNDDAFLFFDRDIATVCYLLLNCYSIELAYKRLNMKCLEFAVAATQMYSICFNMLPPALSKLAQGCKTCALFWQYLGIEYAVVNQPTIPSKSAVINHCTVLNKEIAKHEQGKSNIFSYLTGYTYASSHIAVIYDRIIHVLSQKKESPVKASGSQENKVIQSEETQGFFLNKRYEFEKTNFFGSLYNEHVEKFIHSSPAAVVHTSHIHSE